MARVKGMFSFGLPTNVPAADGVEVFKARLHLFGGALLPTFPPTLLAGLFYLPQPLLCADGAQRCTVHAASLHSFHGYVWNRHLYRPGFLLYIFTVLHSDSSASSALPLRFCASQNIFWWSPPRDVIKGSGISPNSSNNTPQSGVCPSMFLQQQFARLLETISLGVTVELYGEQYCFVSISFIWDISQPGNTSY